MDYVAKNISVAGNLGGLCKLGPVSHWRMVGSRGRSEFVRCAFFGWVIPPVLVDLSGDLPA
jgi:hypothetical protein